MAKMINFDDLKVIYKLGILVIIAFLMMGITTSSGYRYLQQSNITMNILYNDRLIPVKDLNEMCTAAAGITANYLELTLVTDMGKKKQLVGLMNSSYQQTSAGLDELAKSHLDSRAKELLTRVQATREKYWTVCEQGVSLAMQNKNAEAYAFYLTDIDKLSGEYMAALRALSDYYTELSRQMNEDNQAEFTEANHTTLAVCALAFLLLGWSAWAITKLITRPLSQMVGACEQMADGDFRDQPGRVLRQDEMGQVADSLATMRNKVRTLMKTIDRSVDQVAAASEELTASADQSAQAATQVVQAITDVAQGMKRQMDITGGASAVIRQMSAGIQQMAVNAGSVSEQSALAAHKAGKGNVAADKAMRQMTSIEQTVINSAEIVVKLGERSKEIGQIVDTIAGIAGQTNLLALNAAIEAARAGEQGRGFAVVAEEVRKLAEQSQEAAKQVAALISSIQGDTQQAVAAMQVGSQEVRMGAEIVNASGQAFHEISQLITQVSGQVEDMSAAVEQMAVGSQRMVDSVNQIDDLSKKAAGEAQSVSAATEEQSAVMEEISSSSQGLSSLAMELREAVNRFQIG